MLLSPVRGTVGGSAGGGPVAPDYGNNIYAWTNRGGDKRLVIPNTSNTSTPRIMTAGLYVAGTPVAGSAGRSTLHSSMNGLTLPQATIYLTGDVSVALPNPGDADWTGSFNAQVQDNGGTWHAISYTGFNRSPGNGAAVALTGCTGGTGTLATGGLFGPLQRAATGGTYKGTLQVLTQVVGGATLQGGGLTSGGSPLWGGDGGNLGFDGCDVRLVLGGFNYRNITIDFGAAITSGLAGSLFLPQTAFAASCDRIILWYGDYQDYTAVTGWTVNARGMVVYGYTYQGVTNCVCYGFDFHDIKTSPIKVKRLANASSGLYHPAASGMRQKNILMGFQNSENHIDTIEGLPGPSSNWSVENSQWAVNSYRTVDGDDNSGANHGAVTGVRFDTIWFPCAGGGLNSQTHLQFVYDTSSAQVDVTLSNFSMWTTDQSAITSPYYATGAGLAAPTIGANVNVVTATVSTPPTMDGGHSAYVEADIYADSHNPATVWRNANPFGNLDTFASGGWS